MNTFQLLWKSNFALLLRRLALVYLAIAVCRAVFGIYNSDVIGNIAGGEVWGLFKGSLLFDSISIIYSNSLFILASLIPLRIRERDGYRRFLFLLFVIVNTVVIGLNMADVVYFHYTQIRLTAADMMFAANDNTFLLMLRFAGENWYLVLLWLALSFLVGLAYRWTGNPDESRLRSGFYHIFHSVVLIAVTVGCIAVVRGGGLKRTIRPVAMGNAMLYADSPAKASLILSNPFCIIRTAGSEVVPTPRFFDPQDLETIFTPYHYPAPQPDSVNVGKKNVVIFVLESFSAELSAYLSPAIHEGTDGYTPFLDSLMRESLTMRYAFANGRKSIDALPSILGSIPSFRKPFALMPQSLGRSRQLPAMLGSAGYSTMFFCGSPAGSMGFSAYARQAGIETIYSKEDYDRRYPGHNDGDGYWGIWDEDYLRFMGEILSETSQPFFSTVFTLSSHHPFVVPAKYEAALPWSEAKIGRPAAYTDLSVRKFFERYGHQPWFANTIFVFVADHTSSEKVGPDSGTVPERQRIVTFFHTLNGSLSGSYHGPFQQLDIMPTLLGMLGNEEPFFAFGTDFRDNISHPGQSFAMTYNGQYAAFSDKYTILMDDSGNNRFFDRADLYLSQPVDDPQDGHQGELGDRIRALVQQYYTHVGQMRYTVPEDPEPAQDAG